MPSSTAPRTRPPPAFDQGIRPGSVLALATPSNVDFVAVPRRRSPRRRDCRPQSPFHRARAAGRCTQRRSVIASPALAAAMGPIDSSIAVVDAGDNAHTMAARFRVPDAAPVPDPPDDPERPVCICFTSGSTGQPRGGWYANRQLQAIADLGRRRLRWRCGLRRSRGPRRLHDQVAVDVGQRSHHTSPRRRARPILDLITQYQMPAITGVAPDRPPAQPAQHRRARLRSREGDRRRWGRSLPALVEEARRLRRPVLDSLQLDRERRYRPRHRPRRRRRRGAALDRPTSPESTPNRDENGTSLPDGEVGELCLPCWP